MAIRALPTFYDGIQFRSRLEARWAYFFNLCKVQWQYELQGYESDEHRYLPDFYLQETEMYVEIKPNMGFVEDSIVNRKMAEFARSIPGKFVVFVDTPVKARYYSYEAGYTDLNTKKPYPGELHFAWLQNDKGQFQPHYYPLGLTADTYIFEKASNFRF